MHNTLPLTFMLTGNLAVVYFRQETLYIGVLYTISTLLGPPPLIQLGRRCDVLNLTMFFITYLSCAPFVLFSIG
jgi:hypothetical protein